MLDNLIEVINEMNTFTTNIQINHFDSDQYTTQKDHFNNIQDANQTRWDDVNNSEHNTYNILDSSRQIYGIEHTDITIVSIFLQGLFLQHLHKRATTTVPLRLSILVSLCDHILHHFYQGIHTNVYLQLSLPMCLQDNVLHHLYRDIC